VSSANTLAVWEGPASELPWRAPTSADLTAVETFDSARLDARIDRVLTRSGREARRRHAELAARRTTTTTTVFEPTRRAA
jgi:hypothetical protein